MTFEIVQPSFSGSLGFLSVPSRRAENPLSPFACRTEKISGIAFYNPRAKSGLMFGLLGCQCKSVRISLRENYRFPAIPHTYIIGVRADFAPPLHRAVDYSTTSPMLTIVITGSPTWFVKLSREAFAMDFAAPQVRFFSAHIRIPVSASFFL